jgi:hypothetical protein
MPTKKAKLIPKNKILSVTIRRVVDESPDTSWMGEYSQKQTSAYSIDRAHSEDCASVSLEAKKAKETLEHAQQTVGDLDILAQYDGTLAYEKLGTERDALDEAYNQLGELADEVTECDCGETGDMERNEYRYFNPSFNYVTKDDKLAEGLTDEEVRKYVRQDYERMQSLNRGDWCFIGIRADAEIEVQVYAGCPPTKPYITNQTQEITSGGVWGYESDMSQTGFEEAESEQLADLKDQLAALGFSRRAISTAFKSIERRDN